MCIRDRGIRSAMGLYANLRPAKLFPQLSGASPLKPEIVARGIDLLMVRELIGGAYFGDHITEEKNGEKVATDLMTYSEHEIERIARTAFNTCLLYTSLYFVTLYQIIISC